MFGTAGPVICFLVKTLAASPTGTGSHSDDVAAHFQAAVEASRASQFDRAIAEYKVRPPAGTGAS
jgi:hypothetical protein